jgi:hypothetical protein
MSRRASRLLSGCAFVTVLLSLALLGAAAAFATPPAPSATTQPTLTTPIGIVGPAGTTPGIQVGPPPHPGTNRPAAPTTTVGGDQPSHPAFWDLPGRVKKAINDWFRSLVLDALTPMLTLVGNTVLSTPQLAGIPQVAGLWQISLIAADGLLVLCLLVGAGLAMSHDTLQTHYALKDLLRRVAFAGIVINASLSLCGQFTAVSNALAQAFLGDGATAAASTASLQNLIVGSLADGGIFLTLLGLGCAVAAVALVILYLPPVPANRGARAALVARARGRVRDPDQPGDRPGGGGARLLCRQRRLEPRPRRPRQRRQPAPLPLPALHPGEDPVLGQAARVRPRQQHRPPRKGLRRNPPLAGSGLTWPGSSCQPTSSSPTGSPSG